MSRILSCPVPENVNPLSPNGYMFTLQRIPEISYFCQEVSMPSITLPTVDVSTPFSRIPLPGDTMEFNDLEVQFLVDSTMANYKALFNWIRGLGFPENYTQYTDQVRSSMNLGETPATMSDASLIVLGKNNAPVQSIMFKDCVITNLNSLTFTSTSQDVQYLVGNATFRYSYATFVE